MGIGASDELMMIGRAFDLIPVQRSSAVELSMILITTQFQARNAHLLARLERSHAFQGRQVFSRHIFDDRVTAITHLLRRVCLCVGGCVCVCVRVCVCVCRP